MMNVINEVFLPPGLELKATEQLITHVYVNSFAGLSKARVDKIVSPCICKRACQLPAGGRRGAQTHGKCISERFI